ncbi:MAG TPA: ABC transporter permease [Thermoanaerobaculia bacterium]|nr:ABC transporter permease [Thermoanaerobaculia bacterium]
MPIALLALLSLAARWPYPEIWPGEIRLDPWRELLDFQHGGLPRVLGASILLSTVVALVSTALSYLAAKRIAAHPARARLSLLAYAPYVMSPVVLGVCLLYLYLKLGLAGTFPGVVLAQTIFATSFGVVFFLGFWNEEKRALEDLVRTLGGTTWQLYSRVLLPISRGPLGLCAFQTFLISWFQYGLTVLIGGGAVQTLPMKVFDYVNEANLSYAALASLLLVLPPLLLLWVNKRLFFRIV